MCVIFLSSTQLLIISVFPPFVSILEFHDEIFDEKQIPLFTNAVSLDCDLIYGMSVLKHYKNGALTSALVHVVCVCVWKEKHWKNWRKLLRWNFPARKEYEEKTISPRKNVFHPFN